MTSFELKMWRIIKLGGVTWSARSEERKMSSSMDLRIKQRAVIEFLTAEGCSPIEIYSRMKVVYGEMCLDLIRENRSVKQIEISIEIAVSQERVHHIITNLLGYRKVSARWVPRMLTPQMKLQRVHICRKLLAKFDEDGEDFLRQIVTGDESWVHHYRSNSRRSIDTKRHHLLKNQSVLFRTEGASHDLLGQ
ncbi:histone-lysine n-methyltransferase setmar-like protein [Elysia marginata]|uniref:Histone-lysine n-methyltransferase setmar-like protein n=1 Tax=Elysia marginata TaxID=1093978 RepID=A0AAV4EJ22_9GAST|nr:histone-lysine n-methyltransferase setmar-like protein [Elysia marginata]